MTWHMTIIWCMVPEIWSATDKICHSGLCFAHLPPYGPRKSIFWKNENKPEDNILQMCTINDSHMCTVPEIWSATDKIFYHFGLLFVLSYNHPPPLPPSPYLEISSFYKFVPKIMITWCTVPEIWCARNRWTDGRLDGRTGWKKWHIEEVSAPPKNYCKRYTLLNVLIISFLISYFSYRFYSTWWCRKIMKHFIL